MTQHPANASNETRLFTAARDTARREIARLARDPGGGTRPAPATTTSPATRDADPIAGLRAALNLEIASQITARDYIRQAREAGHGWAQIGRALDPQPTPRGTTAMPTDVIYDYAAGPHDPATPWHRRTFWWTCHSCDQHIADRGLIASPADNEIGHADDCPRLTAAITEWEASWETEWEAGE